MLHEESDKPTDERIIHKVSSSKLHTYVLAIRVASCAAVRMATSSFEKRHVIATRSQQLHSPSDQFFLRKRFSMARLSTSHEIACTFFGTTQTYMKERYMKERYICIKQEDI